MFATSPRRAARALLAGLSTALVACVLLAGCGDAPSKDQCDRLLAHLIDLELAAGGGKGAATSDDAKADQSKQKTQIATAAADKFHDACVNKTPTSIVECSLAARSLDAVAACDQAAK